MELFPNVTNEVADQSDWISLCSAKHKNSPTYLNSVFSKAAKEAKEAGLLSIAELYGLLSQVFSMYYKQNSPNDPFGPMMVMHDGRTAIVTDFTELNLGIFKPLAFGPDEYVKTSFKTKIAYKLAFSRSSEF